MDKNMLMSVVVKNGETVKDLAEHLGKTANAVYYKLRGESEFTAGEIKTVKKLYKLSCEEIDSIFFN